MTNQLSIHSALSVRGSGASTGPPQTVTPQTGTPQIGTPQIGTSHTGPPQAVTHAHSPAAPPVKPVALFVNPSFRFDPTVGLVVIQFHDDNGVVTNSIPSQRQLQAYRTHQETPPGEQSPKASQPADGKTSAG